MSVDLKERSRIRDANTGLVLPLMVRAKFRARFLKTSISENPVLNRLTQD